MIAASSAVARGWRVCPLSNPWPHELVFEPRPTGFAHQRLVSGLDQFAHVLEGDQTIDPVSRRVRAGREEIETAPEATSLSRWPSGASIVTKKRFGRSSPIIFTHCIVGTSGSVGINVPPGAEHVKQSDKGVVLHSPTSDHCCRSNARAQDDNSNHRRKK